MFQRLRNRVLCAFGRGACPDRVRSHVDLPSIAEIPDDVLRKLRLLDPELDAYVVSGGDVWLLHRQADKGRIHEGQKILLQDRYEEHEGYLEFNVSAHLMAQGFALLDVFPFHRGTSAGFMERAAQQVLYKTESDMKVENALAVLEANSTAQAERRAKVIQERIRSDAKHDHAWAYRGRRNFTRRGP